MSKSQTEKVSKKVSKTQIDLLYVDRKLILFTIVTTKAFTRKLHLKNKIYVRSIPKGLRYFKIIFLYSFESFILKRKKCDVKSNFINMCLFLNHVRQYSGENKCSLSFSL